MRRSGTRGERQLLRVGEYLVRRACQRLPRNVREERHREWSAELPAILHDPEIRFAPWRAVRMLSYAADTVRGTAMTRGRGRGQRTAELQLMLLVTLGALAWDIWTTARAPGQGRVTCSWSGLSFLWPFPSASLWAPPGAGAC
jgi:hypothetical protein